MLGHTTETKYLVSNEQGQGRNFHSIEERSRENQDPKTSMASTSRKFRVCPGSLPLCPTPQLLIADFEGYQIDNDYFIKELAFYEPFGMFYWVGTFKFPFSLASCKKKFIDNLEKQKFINHGLDWDRGEYFYSSLPHWIACFASKYHIYVPNDEKTHILRQITGYLFDNLSCMDIPPLYDLPFGAVCPFHDSTQNSCALDKAVRLGH